MNLLEQKLQTEIEYWELQLSKSQKTLSEFENRNRKKGIGRISSEEIGERVGAASRVFILETIVSRLKHILDDQ
jgi:uncharacterized protein YwlG (UPF0340 family)